MLIKKKYFYKFLKKGLIMKKLLLLASAIILFAGMANNLMATDWNETATATATGIIVAPITISHSGTHMAFGNIAVDATTAGTVVLAPAGTRLATGGCQVPVAATNKGTITAAVFTVTGEGAYTFAITLPVTYTINHSVTFAESMTVTNFTTNGETTTTGLLSGGTFGLNVGATLNVGAAQLAGTYTNETGFDVTVNYN